MKASLVCYLPLATNLHFIYIYLYTDSLLVKLIKGRNKYDRKYYVLDFCCRCEVKEDLSCIDFSSYFSNC